MNFNSIKDFIGSILFPQKCAFCQDISDNGTVVCEKCKQALTKLIFESKFNFRHKKYSFAKKLVAVFEYNDLTSQAILRLKNIGDREVVNFFGELLYEEYLNSFVNCNIDMIVPVPMHKIKFKKRGFNHAECISEYVSQKTGIPLKKDVLIKVKNNKTQHFLSEQQRRENILGVYKAINEDLIMDKQILIIDDVMTTGSTLSECAKVLYGSGAKSVSAIVIGATSQRK